MPRSVIIAVTYFAGVTSNAGFSINTPSGTILPLPHHRSSHVVGNHRGRNAVFHQLPRRQPRPLQKRPRLIRVDVNLLPRFHRRANHAQRRPITSCRERPSVAVRQHSTFTWHQRRALPPHRLVRGNIFRMHAFALFDQRLFNLCHRTHPQSFELLLHTRNRPKQIHRRRPRCTHVVADRVELALEISNVLRLRRLHSQRNPHGRRHPNRRRSAHHHRPDCVRHLLVRLASEIGFFRRQLRLVDEAHALLRPFKRVNHFSWEPRTTL